MNESRQPAHLLCCSRDCEGCLDRLIIDISANTSTRRIATQSPVTAPKQLCDGDAAAHLVSVYAVSQFLRSTDTSLHRRLLNGPPRPTVATRIANTNRRNDWTDGTSKSACLHPRASVYPVIWQLGAMSGRRLDGARKTHDRKTYRPESRAGENDRRGEKPSYVDGVLTCLILFQPCYLVRHVKASLMFGIHCLPTPLILHHYLSFVH